MEETGCEWQLPASALNGTAHAWHHSIPQLARSIKEGGKKLGGVMPHSAINSPTRTSSR